MSVSTGDHAAGQITTGPGLPPSRSAAGGPDDPPVCSVVSSVWCSILRVRAAGFSVSIPARRAARIRPARRARARGGTSPPTASSARRAHCQSPAQALTRRRNASSVAQHRARSSTATGSHVGQIERSMWQTGQVRRRRRRNTAAPSRTCASKHALQHQLQHPVGQRLVCLQRRTTPKSPPRPVRRPAAASCAAATCRLVPCRGARSWLILV